MTNREKDVGLHDLIASGWFNSTTRELAPGFPIVEGDALLDIGCGGGGYSRFCAEKGARVTVADIDYEKVHGAASYILPTAKVTALVTNSNPIPLPNAYFDKVICLEVMEHVEDPKSFLSEIIRVSKPGAMLLVAVPEARSEKLQQELAPDCYFLPPNHIRIFKPGELAALLTSQGLLVESQMYQGFYDALRWTLFWTCGPDPEQPLHPLLQAWSRTWSLLLESSDGLKIKRLLDNVLPKTEAIIARKPF